MDKGLKVHKGGVFMINKKKIENIPTLEQIEDIYKEELRYNASKNKVDDSEISLLEGQFFNKFRKCEEVIEIQKDDEFKSPYYEKYKSFKEIELNNKKEEIEYLKNLLDYENFFLNWERKLNKKTENYTGYGSSSSTRYRIDKIKELEKKLDILINNSPEAWETFYKNVLLEDIEKGHSGSLINVDYVKNSKSKVLESLNIGIPVYIVGHLGSGKTQLATEAAIEFTINNKKQIKIEKEMEKWFLQNKDASEEMAISKFKEINEKLNKHYRDILKVGSKSEVEKLQPLFISGSHNLTYEDMFVEKTLTLSHSFNKGSFADYLDMIIVDFYQWMEEHENQLNSMTEEEQLNLKIQIWKSFSDLLVTKNSAFGTEVQKIEREILIAVREGRVVIVDELNTIAMQNLIALNDILQKHIGSKAYITGVGPVTIQEGFGFIGTGNLSTQMVNYEGTNELNPAFKSRFLTMEYNYVSQNTIGTLKDQENPMSNELFRIIVARLLDKNGNLNIPNPEETLDDLFRFAQLSRVTQNVFMGKWRDNDFSDEEDIDELELREAVLSIRNIIHVLDNWNMGEEKDLSKALWDGFLSSITYADDQNYILSQAVRFGFFKQADGWNVKSKSLGDSTTTYSEIRKEKYSYSRGEIKSLSYLDILNILFGDEPKREKLPDDLRDEFREIIELEGKITLRKYEELDRKLSSLEHSINILEYLEDKED